MPQKVRLGGVGVRVKGRVFGRVACGVLTHEETLNNAQSVNRPTKISAKTRPRGNCSKKRSYPYFQSAGQASHDRCSNDSSHYVDQALPRIVERHLQKLPA